MSVPVSLADIRLARPGGAFTLAIPRLDVAAAERVALVGPSGAGKTTLLHLIAGLVLPDSGSIVVGDTNVHQLNESGCRKLRRTRIGIVFQSSALIPHLTVLENVLLSRRLHHPFRPIGDFMDRALQLLAAVSLDGMAARMPEALSAGEQQRVAVCRALLPRPQLLLADEPTANLDTDSTRIVSALMHEQANQTGITILCATHDPELLGLFGRRVALRQGAIVS
jgi:putative ABC transport system ATP-binding protein